MARKIDYLTIRITAFIIIIAWSMYIADKLLWGLILGIIIFILFNLVYSFYEKKKRPYTSSQLAFYYILNDNSIDSITKLIPEDVSYITDKNQIVTANGEIIYISFNFSQFSMNDILKAIKSAKLHKAKMLTVITTEIDRRIYSIINRSDIPINIINIKQLMSKLIKNNLLPDIKNEPKSLNSFKEIFNQTTAGRFFLSGSIIAIISILMPIKLYYLIISGICFTLGLICFINPSKKTNNKSILK